MVLIESESSGIRCAVERVGLAGSAMRRVVLLNKSDRSGVWLRDGVGGICEERDALCCEAERRGSIRDWLRAGVGGIGWVRDPLL